MNPQSDKRTNRQECKVELHTLSIKAQDGNEFTAIRAVNPEVTAKGGVVILPEVYGLTSYIEAVAIRFAREGYLSIVPSLFDRLGREGVKVSFAYDEAEKAYNAATKMLTVEKALLDITAAVNHITDQEHMGAALVGFSYGATLGWIAASSPGSSIRYLSAYYGSRIALHASLAPRCPYDLHFGRNDPHLSEERLRALEHNIPAEAIFWHDNAGHGFDCHDRISDFCQQASEEAFRLTISRLGSIFKEDSCDAVGS